MQAEILEKLNEELNKEITSEPQVVYIISRVRKMLEMQSIKRDFPLLNFYSNWALHAEIDDIRAVQEILEKIIANNKEAEENLATKFIEFHQELKKFLAAFDLSTKVYDSDASLNQFNALLSQIYSDTFLRVIKSGIKIRFEFDKDSPAKGQYFIEGI